ncbi:LysE/ArgO family amino acid transporter [Streptomyces violarus]|uniref:Arginine exporter protein ArgO n=1 Tax=Streptomyces violarus TaxID=67380 RepID=A0A7W5EZ27_9ACTN|nr:MULTISPECIES: LysE family transporter [Streptomyces]MBB3073954.1 arginine exporter protein ArgO [Streptomyces violarus]WRT96685.1 LysE family transporter [Streptomyces sp. CGMCC 4.1772]
MTAALVAGLLAGYGIAVPVGAVGTYLVSLSARTSLRTGVCAALGVATADGLYALAATLGGTALAAALRPVLGPLRWVCVLVLLGLAVRGTVTAVREYRGHRLATRTAPAAQKAPGPARAYAGLLGITLLNPTTVIYFAALVLGSQATGPAGPVEEGVFVLAAFAASAGWQVLLAGSGALLGRALTGHRGRLATALVASGVMTALAVRMAVSPG